MKKSIKLLSLLMVLIMLFGVFSISASAANNYGIMAPVNNRFTQVVQTVTLRGRYDYLNLAIDSLSDNTYFAIGIFSDDDYENLVWEDAVECDAGSYVYTPYVTLKNLKSGTYYALTFAYKVTSAGDVDIDETSLVSFKVKVDRTTSFDRQMVILKSSANSVNGPVIKWHTLSGASKYIVYRRRHNSTKWSRVGTTTSTSLTDKAMKNKSGAYVYTVRAVNKSGTSSRYQFMGLETPIVGTPKVSNVTVNGNDHTIKWNAISNIKTYRVYRKVEGGNYKQIGIITDGKTIFVDRTEKDTGAKYIYTVRAERKLWGECVKSKYYTNGEIINYIEAPTVSVVETVDDNTVHIEWNSVEDAVYTVYRKVDGGSWQILEKNYESTSYEDVKVKENGSSYAYTVRANIGDKRGHYVSSKFNTFIEMPEIIDLNVTEKTADLTWKPVEGAEGYTILSKSADEARWTEIASVGKDETTYSENIQWGVREYSVRTIGADGTKGSYNGDGVQYANIPDVVSVKVVSFADKSNKLTWSPLISLMAESGSHNIYRKTGSAGEWVLIKDGIKATEYIDDTIEYGVEYSYKVTGVVSGIEGNKDTATVVVADVITDNTQYAEMYNNAINNAKQNAITVTKVKDGIVNYNDIVDFGELSNTVELLSSENFADSADNIAIINQEVTKEDIPPFGLQSAVAQSGIKTAAIEDAGDYTILTIVSRAEENPVVGGVGVGSLCTLITEEQVSAAIQYSSEQINGEMIGASYENVTVVAKIEKTTGNLVNLKIDAPAYIYADVKVGEYKAEGKLGVQTITEFDIAY